MVTLMGFGAGIALILSVWAVYFRDLGYLWNIFSQVWFYATPVIYDPHRFDGQVSDTALFFLHWNPPSVYLRALRHTVYDGRFPRETLVLAQVLFSFVQCSIEMVALGIALAVMGSPLYAYVPVTLLLMVTLMGFGAGIASILSVWAGVS